MKTTLGHHVTHGAVVWNRDGAYFDLDAKDYYGTGFNEAVPECSVVSKSLLWRFMPDPRRWLVWDRHQDISDKPNVLHGKLVDALATMGDLDEFVVSEFDDYRAKAAREWRDGVVADGKTPITKEQDRAARCAYDRLCESQFWQEAISGCTRFQVACMGSFGKQRVKGLIDCVPDGDGELGEYLVDLKTTGRLGTEKQMSYLMEDQGWHVQAALYLDLWNGAMVDYNEPIGENGLRSNQRDKFRFVVQENSEPYQVGAWDVTPRALSEGCKWYRATIERWVQCVTTGVWPSRFDAPLTIDLPRRAYEQ